MESKIELPENLKDGIKSIEIDNFSDALKITSQPENFEGIELIPTGPLKEKLQQIENESIN